MYATKATESPVLGSEMSFQQSRRHGTIVDARPYCYPTIAGFLYSLQTPCSRIEVAQPRIPKLRDSARDWLESGGTTFQVSASRHKITLLLFYFPGKKATC